MAEPTDYYHYQAAARGVAGFDDVRRIAESRAHLYHRLVAPWLPVDRSAPIAELACGHGSFLHWLQGRGYRALTGIDNSPEQTTLARQTGATIVETDVVDWLRAAPSASHATLLGIDLIEHMPKGAFLDLLAESRRVLQPGGSLILRYPNGDSPLVGLNLFNDVTHVWTYTSNCTRTLATMYGFARAEFADESEAAIRDSRWLKVPLHRVSCAALNALFRAASYENVTRWSPHLWARLISPTESAAS